MSSIIETVNIVNDCHTFFAAVAPAGRMTVPRPKPSDAPVCCIGPARPWSHQPQHNVQPLPCQRKTPASCDMKNWASCICNDEVVPVPTQAEQLTWLTFSTCGNDGNGKHALKQRILGKALISRDGCCSGQFSLVAMLLLNFLLNLIG